MRSVYTFFLKYQHLCFSSTAQVPDDEQFVPDFQPDSCEYLRCIIYTPLLYTLNKVQ